MNAARRPRSLFWAFAGAFLGAALLGTVIQNLIAVAVLRPLEERELRTRAELAVSRFAAEMTSATGASDSVRVLELLRRIRSETELRAPLLYRRDRFAVADRPEFSRRLADAMDHPDSTTRDARTGQRYPTVTLAARVIRRGNGPVGQVAVLYAPRPDRSVWGFRPEALLLSLPIALLASLLAALVIVRLLVGRLRTLERFAQRVADDDLSARVDDTNPDEIGRLSEQFNHMVLSLAAARDRLTREERQRRQLFADITHELATPLTSIRGYTETLLDPRVELADTDRTRYLRNTLEESRRLDRLIRDLFDLARLEAGASPLEREPLDLVQLCRNVAERFQPRFTRVGLTLQWDTAPAEAWIDADGHRIEQVVENLLNNALRYVPPGGTVRIAVSVIAGDDGAAAARLTVSDDGPGAPPEEMERLFQRFYRAPGATKSSGAEPDGSGLGLAIVREIVERHGGSIRARARAPHGLEIELDLPAAAPGTGG